ncbi:MAG: DUF1028 domain-containing protein [Alphaproteobacteria bacterium]
MTFSIVGRCARTGMVGMAISTSSIAVTGRCAWVRAQVGAVATQNVTDPVLGVQILDLMEEGAPPEVAVREVVAGARHIAFRQLSAVDREGRTAHYTGAKALGTARALSGRDCAAAGNILANPDVPAAMVRVFEGDSEVHLAERLLRALEGGLVAGGEHGPVHSAGLIVAADQLWPVVNLRVDWADESPVNQLRTLWEAYEPQMQDYIMRALDPDSARLAGAGAGR